jgi:succinate dehydrogenase / fumarate reductase flavoprotein subunit
MGAFRSALAKSAFDLPGSLFERGEAAEEQKLQRLSARIHPGESETAALLEAELCELMLAECGVERENHRLETLLNRVFDLEKRARRVGDSGADKGRDGLRQLRRLDDMLLLSKATALAALRRDECRGCHYKPAFEAVERDDERWLRTTLLRVDGSGELGFVSELSYECAGRTLSSTDVVEANLLASHARDYGDADVDARSPLSSGERAAH